MKEIKDHMDRGVQLTVEGGLFVITHAEGVLKLYSEDAEALYDDVGDSVIDDRPKPEPKVEIDPQNPPSQPPKKKPLPKTDE